MPTETIAGYDVHVLEAGDEGAPPLLAIHSSGLGAAQWRRLLERFAPTHHVIAPDLLGYGGSPWPAGAAFDPAFDLAVVEGVLARLGAPAHVIGHSYGGFLALQAAARRPARVATLTVYEPVAFGVLRSAGAPVELAASIDRARFFDLEAGGLDAFIVRFLEFWGGPGAWDALPDAQRAIFTASASKLYQEVRALSYDDTPHTAYAAIAAPTLVLSGAQTRPEATALCDVLARTIAGADRRVIAGAGHMGPLTHAAAVYAALAEHMGS